jgi:hypothetical protein
MQTILQIYAEQNFNTIYVITVPLIEVMRYSGYHEQYICENYHEY